MRRKGVVFSKMFVLRSMGNELVPSPLVFCFDKSSNGRETSAKIISVLNTEIPFLLISISF